jgi:hypothetical protein
MKTNITGTELENWKNDDDWKEAFATSGYDIQNVTKVIVCDEGENDGDNWIAIVKWNGVKGKYAIIDAGCDFTGWDCQGWGNIEFFDSEEVAKVHLTPEQATRLGVDHDAFHSKNQ